MAASSRRSFLLAGGTAALILLAGAGPAAAEPLAQLTGRPVLTMGEGAEFCSSGGLFCLVPRPAGHGLRVEVNLDAVARSGLHVHPQVLKIGLPRTGATP